MFGAQGFSGLLVEELKEHSLPSSVHEKADFIQTSTEKMSRLLENLLDWARLQTGSLIIQKKEFPLVQTIHEAMYLLQSSANIKNISIIYDGPLEADAVGDARIIETIIRNFISNAIKFSEEQEKIDIQLQDKNGSWKIAVRDYGVGMKDELKKNLFDPELRPDQQGTQNEKGTGLGLILCKDLMENYGGSIAVESEFGNGTEMSITFPKLL